jgi:hypothetical protein
MKLTVSDSVDMRLAVPELLHVDRRTGSQAEGHTWRS